MAQTPSRRLNSAFRLSSERNFLGSAGASREKVPGVGVNSGGRALSGELRARGSWSKAEFASVRNFRVDCSIANPVDLPELARHNR